MKWSVLIPVYLGEAFAPILRRALEAWSRVSARDLEIVLCCDGPDPRVEAIVREVGGPFPMRVFSRERRGQSAATNRAAREACGECLLFSAQDIVPTPTLVEEHERARARHAGYVIQGYLPYPPELPCTPFMDFLIHGGPQFAFDAFRDGAPIPPFCLYAPNFSMSREEFLGMGGFREDLPYACQDTELGFRLAMKGRTIFYCSTAVGYHWHPQSLDGYVERQYKAGRNTVSLARLYPEHRKIDWLKEKVLEYFVGAAPCLPGYLAWIGRIEREPEAWKVFVRSSPAGPYEQAALWFLYDRVTKYHFYRGVHDALEEAEPGWMERSFAPWRLSFRQELPRFLRLAEDGVGEPSKKSEVNA